MSKDSNHEEQRPEQPQNEELQEQENSETLKQDQDNNELAELKDILQHLQAEFENYKKRCSKEQENFIKYSNEDLIRNLLPIIDNFELALKSCKEKNEFYKGMELIYSQLVEILESNGLKHIQSQGQKFDPYYHEALLSEEADCDPNTVVSELQKGYLLHDRVIRPCKVKISKKKQKEKQPEQEAKKENNSE